MLLIKNDSSEISLELQQEIHFKYQKKNDFSLSSDIRFDNLRNNEGNRYYEHGFEVDNETAYYQFLTDWNKIIKKRQGVIRIDQMTYPNTSIEFLASKEHLEMLWADEKSVFADDFEWQDVFKTEDDIPELDEEFWVITRR